MEEMISVILPIYNVEPYLRRAVDSIIAQTYELLQIILVEDGSPDDCGSICEEYAQKDSRITVVHKENGGLSDARNVGISFAKGNYIAFVDSDDYIAPQFIEMLYQAIKETGSDIAICNYIETTCDGLFKQQMQVGNRIEYSARELSLNMYADIHKEYTCFVVAWNKLYKRSLWDQVRFPKGRIHEDEATTYRIYDKVHKGVLIQTPLYAYYQLDTSITRKPFSNRRLDCLLALEDRISFYIHRQDPELVMRTFKTLADTAIIDYKIVSQGHGCNNDGSKWSSLEEKQIKNELKNYVTKTLKSVNLYGNLPWKTMVGYHLFLWSSRTYYFLQQSK